MDIVEKLLSRIKVNAVGCFEWQGAVHKGGYGVVTFGGRQQQAHRVSFGVFRKVIPDGLCVCHRCDNRKCINPSHLFIGTHKQNSEDMVRKGRAARGADCHSAKLTAEDVARMPDRYAAGESTKQIAESHGIAMLTVSRILSKKIWRHVERPSVVFRREGQRGTQNKNCRLTESDVREIRRLRAAGQTTTAIGRRFGISANSVCRTCSGESWSHVS